MWQGGPLREVYIGAPRRSYGRFESNACGQRVGMYVCDDYMRPTPGGKEEHELRGPPSTWLGHIADEGGERASDTGLVQPP